MMTRQTAGVFIGITLSILLASCDSPRGIETFGAEDLKFIEMMENDPPAKTIPPTTPKER
jgi:hypothetical protein